MPCSDDISEKLKTLRQKRGWSQEDLARELGVSFTTVNRWENAKNKPSKLAVARIKVLMMRKSGNGEI